MYDINKTYLLNRNSCGVFVTLDVCSKSFEVKTVKKEKFNGKFIKVNVYNCKVTIR